MSDNRAAPPDGVDGRRRATVSVVIPAYQAERFIERALRSVLGQTRPAQQVIVVDDASIDRTGDVVRSFGDRVEYVRQIARAGVSAARNRGILSASGSWIALLDADDYWLSYHLERCVNVLHAEPELRWCCGGHQKCTDDGVLFAPPPTEWQSLPGASATSVPYFDATLTDAPLWASGMVLDRLVLVGDAAVGLFDETLTRGEDRDLWCRIAFRYPRIGYVMPPSVRYVRHANAMTLPLRDVTDLRLAELSRCAARLNTVAEPTRSSYLRFVRSLARELLKHALNVGRPDGLARLLTEHADLLTPSERFTASVGSHTPSGILTALSSARRTILHGAGWFARGTRMSESTTANVPPAGR